MSEIMDLRKECWFACQIDPQIASNIDPDN